MLIPKVDLREPLLVQIEHFAACVASGAEPRSGATSARRVVGVLEAAQRSLESGTAQDVRDLMATSPAVKQIPLVDLAAVHEEIGAELEAAMLRVARSQGFIGGAPLNEFEAAFAEQLGVANVVGVGNGTDALELVLRARGIGAGDEVIVPGNTFIATAEAVAAAGRGAALRRRRPRHRADRPRLRRPSAERPRRGRSSRSTSTGGWPT